MKVIIKFLVSSVLINSVIGDKATGIIIQDNDIEELNYLDTSVDPCDNFFQFACGNFKNIHPRPDDEPLVDHFTLLEDKLTKIGNSILTLPKSDDDPIALRKVKSAYKACIDTETADTILYPELQIVEEVGGMPLLNPADGLSFSWNDIGDLVGRYGVPLVFNYQVASMNENDSFIYLEFDNLANPNLFRPFYKKSYDQIMEQSLKEHATSRSMLREAAQVQPFDIFLRTLSRNLADKVNPSKTDEEIIQDLDNMANFMRDLYAGGILDDGYQPFSEDIPTVSALQRWTDSTFGTEDENRLIWKEYLGAVFQRAGIEITDDLLVFFDYSTFQRIYGTINLVRQTDPRIVKNFALFRIFLFLAPDSDKETRQAFEDYYHAKNYKLYDRWEYCTRKLLDIVADSTASVNFATAYSYERYRFNPNKKAEAADLVQNLHSGFGETLRNSDWMDEDSIEAALKKADRMLLLLGLPDFADDNNKLDEFYENVRICEWDNYGNAQRIRAFNQAYQFSQLNTPNLREFWDKSVFNVNAYYSRTGNKIVLPLSMLNTPFFESDNLLLDYSRLGSIIGHEITHGFDNGGKDYDEYGQHTGLWTNSTLQAYNEHTKCFIEQYSKYYIPEIDAYVDGSVTLNENLADNAGVKGSFTAFQKIIKDKGIQNTSNNFSSEQLFFIGYGTMWCSSESPEYLASLTSSGVYPPNRYRVIGALSNSKDFAEAFQCPSGSAMNPETKCSLW